MQGGGLRRLDSGFAHWSAGAGCAAAAARFRFFLLPPSVLFFAGPGTHAGSTSCAFHASQAALSAFAFSGWAAADARLASTVEPE